MTNQTIATILTHARKEEKWVAVASLVQYGLHNTKVLNMEEQGLINRVQCAKHGTLIKLTAKGYREMSSIKGE